jgi:hypothetical protein
MIPPICTKLTKAATRVDGIQAVTIGYCATASDAMLGTAYRYEQRNDWASIPPRRWWRKREPC